MYGPFHHTDGQHKFKGEIMSIELIALLIIVLLFVLFLLGLEIGFSMAVAGFVGFAMIVNLQAAFDLVAQDFYAVFTSYSFTVIPLFVLMGIIGASAGMSKDLYAAASKWFGHVPGGIAIATVAAATLFKAVCGSNAATAATFSTVAIPEMDRYGYDKRISTGTVATVGTLGNLIPPSIGMVIYGLITETSIGKLFLAGIIPGLIVACVFIVTLYFWCKMRPEMGPKGEKSTWRARFLALRSVIGIAVIFIVVIGGLLVGYFSPSESASVGTFAVLLLVIAKREIKFKLLVQAVKDSVRLGCMVLTLSGGSMVGPPPDPCFPNHNYYSPRVHHRWERHRRWGVLHSCHSYFLPHRPCPRLRPRLVWSGGRYHIDDRGHHTSHGRLGFYCIGYHQGADWRRL
jgi:C4-dicarboxylate transporter DctM subunit